MNCCVNCFSDTEIQNYIISSKEIGNCDYCNSNNINVAGVANVGDCICKGIMKVYESLDNRIDSIDDYEIITNNTLGQTLSDILIWDLNIFSYKITADKIEMLVADLINESQRYSNYDWLVTDALVLKNFCGQEKTLEYISWEKFKYTCKYLNRYFDLGGRNSSRITLLSGLNELFKKMKTTIPKETTLYRARSFELEGGEELDDLDLLNELSPAPPDKSKNNRMSPKGISYMYLADSIDTCLVEIRAKSNDNVLIGEFTTKQKLNILDLSIEPMAISIFSSDFDYKKNWIQDFVKHFTQEISMQLSDDEKDIEYIATQVLAEYIRKMGFHGIKYKSSIKPNNFNYVLFCSINPWENYYNNNRWIHNYDFTWFYCNNNISYVNYKLYSFKDWLNLKNCWLYKMSIIHKL